jgi:CTP:molybdopterin cytidylyltransferase MocA
MTIVAIVLAAGAGRRMGGPKALLGIDGTTFLARACERLARPGVGHVVAVLGHAAERVRAQGGAPDGVRLLVNPRHEDGMLGSILCGLDEAERLGGDALLLQPVDHPLVAAATVDRVVDALRGGATIAVPSWEGRRGHPAGFARSCWPALRAASPAQGARAVLRDRADSVSHVPGDPGCVAGIDTPEDYARLVSP